jgi:hypothetical protein
MIKIRVDVDYPYPSRAKSFLYTYMNWKSKNGYLMYSKMLADLINNANIEVKAIWFFNIHALPDKEMLALLSGSQHEIGLHIVNNPFEELEQLEKVSTKPIEYYTIHGTERLLGQIVWHRPLGQKQAKVPSDFRLKSYHEYPTNGLDWLCYNTDSKAALIISNDWAKQGFIFEVHPEWLICRGKINHRGPYLKTLSALLHVSPVSVEVSDKGKVKC